MVTSPLPKSSMPLGLKLIKIIYSTNLVFMLTYFLFLIVGLVIFGNEMGLGILMALITSIISFIFSFTGFTFFSTGFALPMGIRIIPFIIITIITLPILYFVVRGIKRRQSWAVHFIFIFSAFNLLTPVLFSSRVLSIVSGSMVWWLAILFMGGIFLPSIIAIIGYFKSKKVWSIISLICLIISGSLSQTFDGLHTGLGLIANLIIASYILFSMKVKNYFNAP